MKVMTLLGTRPELIRLSRIIPKLDKLSNHVLVHTGQNYDKNMNKIFMDELGIRQPDHQLNCVGTPGQQIAILMEGLEVIIGSEKPDVFLVLGDTNSSLGAIMAKRMGVRVFHMEAGNRCFDDKVPEEVNRRIIDHVTDIHLPYTERSKQNLLAEGIPLKNIYVTGNPIKEVIDYYTALPSDRDRTEYLVTLHRQENVDDPVRLKKFVEAFNKLDKPVLWPVHPRTRKQLKGLKLVDNVKLIEPLGFLDFINKEQHAFCVLTDSGTVQEECALFGTPVVTLRDSTERPETLEAGSNFISGCEPTDILRGIKIVTQPHALKLPGEYMTEDVSDTVVKIVLGYYGS